MHVKRILYTLLFITAVIIYISCANRSAFVEPVELPNHRWEEVYRDNEFIVSVDLDHVKSGPEPGSFVVWYQTERLEMQEENGKPWNREVIRSLLQCDPLEFKTVRVTVFLNDGPPVAQIGGTMKDVQDKKWRAVIPESVDAVSMKNACELINASNDIK